MDVSCSFISSVSVFSFKQKRVVELDVPGGSPGADGTGNYLRKFIRKRTFSF